jgi:hypothetical protein
MGLVDQDFEPVGNVEHDLPLAAIIRARAENSPVR